MMLQKWLGYMLVQYRGNAQCCWFLFLNWEMKCTDKTGVDIKQVDYGPVVAVAVIISVVMEL
jgi:hypothetical protein